MADCASHSNQWQAGVQVHQHAGTHAVSMAQVGTTLNDGQRFEPSVADPLVRQ
jgi:hypothetical protein